MTTRRQILAMLGVSAGASALTLWPTLTRAATGADTRLLVLMLRGGLDGLHAIPPYGDPGYAALRGPLALSPAGPTAAGAAALKLDATFALHPSLAFTAGLYARGECLPIVAAAPPYWGRSHFEAQDCVENGTASPDGAETGWLNRAVGALHVEGLSLTSVMPLMMRGPVKVNSWSPPLPMQVGPILLQRLEPLYGDDPRLARAFAEAIAQQGDDVSVEEAMNGPAMGMGTGMSTGMGMGGKAKPRPPLGAQLPGLMRAAGAFLARADGPRVGFLEDYGWDTHANQAPILTRKLKELDDGFAAFHAASAPVWGRTVVVVVTEFGRTARINGTNGTDHGTGGGMFLVGGAVHGGRVGGTWRGMTQSLLYQDRDILATTDQRAVFKGILAQHLGLSEGVLATSVFPNSAKVAPSEGLVLTRAAA